MKGRTLAAILLLGSASAAMAEPRVNPLFSDHAVLQRGRPIPVWGTAEPGARVTVQFGAARGTAVTGADGTWRVALPARPAGGPDTLSVNGRVVARGVLVGDVWLCSGQSNMELGVNAALNAWNELQSADDPQLRLLTIPHRTAMRPQAEIPGLAWRPASRESVGPFSASCYYMVRALRASQNVPVGAIAASWGGTQIRSWLDATSIAAMGDAEAWEFIVAEHDPARANARFGERWGEWWRQQSGDAVGAEPWRRSDRLTWSPARIGYWEEWGDPRFAGFNGMVWMRKRFTLTAAEAAQGATLSLTVIDELDQTFVNGVAVGSRYSWEAPRDYRLGPNVLRAGENEVIVNVYDGSGAGGLSGPADAVRLTLADGRVKPLGEGWEYSVARIGGNPPRSSFDEAMGFTRIYNGMVAPLGDYGLTGVAWYQGESDVGLAGAYADRLAALMGLWRRQFGRPDLPFLIVGLANYGPFATAPAESGWADLREQQRRAVARDPHAALVVAMDLGERLDIHPGNKQEVGRRLARAAQALAYGAHAPAGPQVVRARRDGTGVIVEFSGLTGALRTWSGTVVLALELCGAEAGSCRYVEGRVDGRNVRIAGDGRPATRVRHAWADSPVTNLYDDAPLPVGPFEVPIGAAVRAEGEQ
ncbi:MAG TPA: sialate O-acetylesterase [Allosphingosinicella sp.]|nr:sialate O-acetylesterase [Allosphingosinicella sp.]